MTPRQRMQQRALDGRLTAAEGRAADHLGDASALAAVDEALKALAAPARRADPAPLAQAVRLRLSPRRQRARVVLTGRSVLLLAILGPTLAGVYAALGVFSQQSAPGRMMLAIAGLSVLLGAVLVLRPQALRNVEVGLWRRLGQPLWASPADVLVVRCLGVVVMLGGAWLLLA